MNIPALGFWFLHRTAAFEEPRATALVNLLTDTRWPWLPNIVRPTQFPGRALYPWKGSGGKTAKAALPSVVGKILRSELTTGVNLVLSPREAGDNAWYHLNSGREDLQHRGVAFPFRAYGMCRTNVPAGKDLNAWLALLRDLASTLDIAHGTIFAEADERWTLSRVFLSGGGRGYTSPEHPATESARVLPFRATLGDRYLRLPAWGTFLRRAHLDAVGGRAHLLDAVQPPIVHDLGDLLYLQLSASVADARAPETLARHQRLSQLLAPITVPLLPQ